MIWKRDETLVMQVICLLRVYTADSIMAGPLVTIEKGSHVTFVARDSISAFNNFVIEEDAQVIFEAPLIRASHDFIIKNGGKLTLTASDSLIIGPDFTVENGAEADLAATNFIQFWPRLRVQEKGRLKANIIRVDLEPDQNTPHIDDGIADGGDEQEHPEAGITYFLDADGDGYGDPAIKLQSNKAQSGYVLNKIDCNDADPKVNPKKMIIRTITDKFPEDFASGRTLIKSLAPSCVPYTTFDLLSDYRNLGTILFLQHRNSRSESFHPAYWFFDRICGSNQELPSPDEDDDLGAIDYVIDRLE